jgi:hypothetical protein
MAVRQVVFSTATATIMTVRPSLVSLEQVHKLRPLAGTTTGRRPKSMTCTTDEQPVPELVLLRVDSLLQNWVTGMKMHPHPRPGMAMLPVSVPVPTPPLPQPRIRSLTDSQTRTTRLPGTNCRTTLLHPAPPPESPLDLRHTSATHTARRPMQLHQALLSLESPKTRPLTEPQTANLPRTLAET